MESPFAIAFLMASNHEGARPLVLLHLAEDRLHEDEIAALADAGQLKAGGERGDGNRSAGQAHIT